MKSHITPQYLTIAEAAIHCSLSEKTIRRLIGRGELPHFRPCRSVLIALADLEAYLNSVRVEAVNLDLLAVR
jgi:excisionase family DNA binding protein